jgi:dihydrofolate synthase/folylpolyglutamate synthase
MKTFSLDLPGHYQAKNLVTVLTAIDLLRTRGWPLPADLVKNGIQQTRKLTGLRGRWEQVHQQPTILVDVAHNAEGIREVLRQLSATSYAHLHWIIGFAKDKDVENILAMLPVKASYYFTKAQLPRALDEKELHCLATQKGLQGRSYPVIREALREALLLAKEADLILVCGSIFLAGEAIEALGEIQETSSPNFRKA